MASLDYSLITGLSRSTYLTDLNLTQSKISSICFLQFLPHLEYLNLTECTNLCDADFYVIKNLHRLDSLYLSFNFISTKCLSEIVVDKPDLQVLEIYGIGLSIDAFHDIVSPCYQSLDHIFLSLSPEVDEEQFYLIVHTYYIDLTPRIYKLDFYDN